MEKMSSAGCFRLEMPLYVKIDVTDACNISCLYCCNPTRHTRHADRLRYVEMQRLLSELREHGVLGVVFSGGEPLLFEGLPGLLRHSRSLTMNATLNTNGYAFDRSFAVSLRDCPPGAVTINVESAQAEIHDCIRGRRGSWQKAIECISTMRQEWPETGIMAVTVVSKLNIDGVRDTVRMLSEIGVHGHAIGGWVRAGRGTSHSAPVASSAELCELQKSICADFPELIRNRRITFSHGMPQGIDPTAGFALTSEGEIVLPSCEAFNTSWP